MTSTLTPLERRVMDALAETGGATLRQLASLSTYGGVRTTLYRLRLAGHVYPPVKDVRGRFWGGPVTYRLRQPVRRLGRWRSRYTDWRTAARRSAKARRVTGRGGVA